MRIIVTGGDGFIGHHFVEHVLVNEPDARLDLLCSFTHGGQPARINHSPRIAKAIQDRRVVVHRADLRAPLGRVMTQSIHSADAIVNFASRSHVDTSLANPRAFFEDNVAIAMTMLELARACTDLSAFVQISTDEVYGPAHGDHRHREWEVHCPSNPYSASKAAQEAAAFSWWRAYGVPVIITNTMNNYGERQDPEKFIPLIMRKILAEEPVMIHGIRRANEWTSGSRYWLHARNHADAVLWLLRNHDVADYEYQQTERCPRFNVVGDTEVSNYDMALKVASALGKPVQLDWMDAHSARPGHDLRYALDGTLLAEAGWVAPVSFEEGLRRTVEWTMQHPLWLA